MAGMYINIRSKTSTASIWAVATHEQLPLHPNYSTSVKERGSIITLQVTSEVEENTNLRY